MKVFMLGTTSMQWARCKALNIPIQLHKGQSDALHGSSTRLDRSQCKFYFKTFENGRCYIPLMSFFGAYFQIFLGCFFGALHGFTQNHVVQLCLFYIVDYVSTISNSTSLGRERIPPFAYFSAGNNSNNIFYYY